ncbi:MAG: alpha/beta hydrolase [Candidatus Obscuribacter phosphatis]|uniref:Alpha/beta hydrolase n=1 Tax=Candidatus Obscuribacter phosphatis TaxID=1906157 RepID=A0A8J7TK75_9BACT|nr:alpha/beta hydrolase [Candidatus Obscuribacter phosphatis]
MMQIAKALRLSALCAALVPGAIYLALSPRNCLPIYRNLLFHPSAFDNDLADEQFLQIFGEIPEQVYFSSGLNLLHGLYFSDSFSCEPADVVTVLINHGNSGNILDRYTLVKWLRKNGLSVFLYDYAGFGLSEGIPDTSSIVSDGVSAFDLLVTRGVAPSRIVLYGESLGVAVSTAVALVRKPAAMLLQSGFSSLRQIAVDTFPMLSIYPQELFPTPSLDSAAMLSGRHPPILIAHGMKDPTVHYFHAQRLFDSASREKKLLLLPNAVHNDLVTNFSDEMTQGLFWLLSHLK